MTSDPRIVFLDGTLSLSKEALGGKAYSINKMRQLGLPVPAAFALTTRMCQEFHEAGGVLSDMVWSEVLEQLHRIEVDTGRTFGRGPSPLLVSVRSGAAESMPGMMDTVLNLGLTPELAERLAAESGDAAWAEDTWKRFCRSYADVVAKDSRALPPVEPLEQLRATIGAVFESWNNERVRVYRARHGLTGPGGTAVTVQAMVFGNRDENSGTGVMFSRDPNSGEAKVTGEWLTHAQGEEVVSGSRTPQTLEDLGKSNPELHSELIRIASFLEQDHKDLVDIEFTVESGRLYVLQCRKGKRSPAAAVRIAVEMVRENIISEKEAFERISGEHVARLAAEKQSTSGGEVVAQGTGIGTGIASGLAVSDLDEAQTLSAQGQDIVLIRATTSPEDVPAMFDSVAVVTEVGGSTSHAALVCREIGLPCVVGCGVGAVENLVGKVVTVDGTSGLVTLGASSSGASQTNPYLLELLSYTDSGVPEDHPLQVLRAQHLQRTE